MKRHLVLRALDEAFRTSELPSSKGDFAERVAEGRTRLGDTLGELVRVAIDLYAEHDAVRAAMKPLVSRPGVTRAVLDDIQTQLAYLVPADLMRATPVARLVNITRYLKAIGVRLQRASHDVQKDQQKAAAVAPFWQKFQTLPDTPERTELLWLIEEFRVQTFAPELKTAVPISAQRLQDAWSRLAR
jgi:ATP-dependent helicase HrpA